jgi:membrane associated rhomboid family serine protease
MSDSTTFIQRNFKFPWFTLNLALLCIALFFWINTISHFGKVSQETYSLFGAPYSIEIYQGQFWGLITNSFIHVLWYHLAINIVGLFVFGAFAERRLSWHKLFLFGLVASFVTSAFQLTFSDDAGIGLSGVNYALFGFIFVKSQHDTRFHVKLKYVMFMLMFIIVLICFYMNYLANWNIGLAAMISGFVWGILVGNYIEYRTKFFSGMALLFMFGFAISTLFYAPWSSEWQCYKGITAHEQGDLHNAEGFYSKALTLDPTNELAAENLKLIKIDKLSTKAFTAHSKGNYSKARFYYMEILRIDKKNQWALENMNKLP